MTGLMDKIRAVLGRGGPQPDEVSPGVEERASEALGSPSTVGSTVLPGEPTLGSARGMNVTKLARRTEAQFEPDGGPADDDLDADGR